MESTMKPQPIAPLMDAVLRTLGRHSRQDYLRLALHQAGLSDTQLLKIDHAPPYPVTWAETGLGLVLQRLAWGDMPGAPTWGVHSVTLDAQRWKGSWPMGLDPETVTAQEFVSLLAQDPAEALCLPQMACCTTDRKSTRLNSSHQIISYAVFCLKKKNYVLKQISTLPYI